MFLKLLKAISIITELFLQHDVTGCVALAQHFSNQGLPRLCRWVAKGCKLSHVKEKICAHKISEVKNLFKRSLRF